MCKAEDFSSFLDSRRRRKTNRTSQTNQKMGRTNVAMLLLPCKFIISNVEN
jgi:hypothetical protein